MKNKSNLLKKNEINIFLIIKLLIKNFRYFFFTTAIAMFVIYAFVTVIVINENLKYSKSTIVTKTPSYDFFNSMSLIDIKYGQLDFIKNFNDKFKSSMLSKKNFKSFLILKKENDNLEKFDITHFNDSYSDEVYQLIHPLKFDGVSFLNEYTIYVKNKLISEILVKKKFEINKEINRLDKQIFIDDIKLDRFKNSIILNKIEDLFKIKSFGEQINKNKIDNLNAKLDLILSNEISYDPILSKALRKNISKISYLYSPLRLIVSFCFAIFFYLFIIFLKSEFKNKNKLKNVLSKL